jgi:hypothetical protein
MGEIALVTPDLHTFDHEEVAVLFATHVVPLDDDEL